MNKKASHIAWLPQGTQIWNFKNGISHILPEPSICLIMERKGTTYDVFYGGVVYNVAKNHVSIVGPKKERYNDNQAG